MSIRGVHRAAAGGWVEPAVDDDGAEVGRDVVQPLEDVSDGDGVVGDAMVRPLRVLDVENRQGGLVRLRQKQVRGIHAWILHRGSII